MLDDTQILDRDKREAAEPSSSGSNVKSSSSINQSALDATSSSSSLSAADLSKQQLLGVNGTGQRKDVVSSSTEPILAATIQTKLSASEASGAAASAAVDAELPVDPTLNIDDIDQGDDLTNTTLMNHNITQMKSVSFCGFNCLFLNKRGLGKISGLIFENNIFPLFSGLSCLLQQHNNYR